MERLSFKRVVKYSAGFEDVANVCYGLVETRLENPGKSLYAHACKAGACINARMKELVPRDVASNLRQAAALASCEEFLTRFAPISSLRQAALSYPTASRCSPALWPHAASTYLIDRNMRRL